MGGSIGIACSGATTLRSARTVYDGTQGRDFVLGRASRWAAFGFAGGSLGSGDRCGMRSARSGGDRYELGVHSGIPSLFIDSERQDTAGPSTIPRTGRSRTLAHRLLFFRSRGRIPTAPNEGKV